MGSVTFTLMFITLFSKGTGLLREMVFSHAFGTSAVKDIYVMSASLTSVLFSFLFLSVSQGFIPMFSRVRQEKGEQAADAFTSNLTNILVVFALAICVLSILFTRPLVRMIAIGFQGAKFEEMVFYTRISVFSLVFTAMWACMISYLNIHGSFRVPATTGIIMNLVTMAFTWLAVGQKSEHGQLLVLAISCIVGVAAQYMLFPFMLHKLRYRHRFKIDFRDPYVKEMLFLSLPLMFSLIMHDFSVICDKTIATMVANDGGVSALDYAMKLYQLFDGIIVVSLYTAFFPRMAKYGQQKAYGPLKRITKETWTIGSILMIPAMVGVMLFAVPIVRLIFQRGAFDAASTQMTAGALFWYAPGLMASVFSQLGYRTFFSLHDTKTPVRITALQVVLNIVFNLVLSQFFGIYGLAFATSFSNLVAAALTVLLLHRRLGAFGLARMTRSIFKCSGLTALMALLAWLVYRAIRPLNATLALLLGIAVGVLIYCTGILFLQISEVKTLVNKLYHKLRRKPARRRSR